jgi:hypothetical protein
MKSTAHPPEDDSPYRVVMHEDDEDNPLKLNDLLVDMRRKGWSLLTMDATGRVIFGRSPRGRSIGTHYCVDVRDKQVRVRLHSRGSKIFDTIDSLMLDGSNAFEEMDRVLSNLNTPSVEVARDLYLAIKSVLEES